jgi:hypothetical protein
MTGEVKGLAMTREGTVLEITGSDFVASLSS